MNALIFIDFRWRRTENPKITLRPMEKLKEYSLLYHLKQQESQEIEHPDP